MTGAEHQRALVSLFMQQSAVHLLDWTRIKDKSGNRDRFFFPNGCILMGETLSHVWSVGREDPLEKEVQPTPVFLPGESHGQRSLWATIHGVAKSRTRLSISMYHVGIVFIWWF